MGLISKICVLFLSWLIFGVVGYAGMAFYYVAKVHLLDAGSRSIAGEYMDTVLANLADGYDEEISRAVKGTILDNDFVVWFLIGLMWPTVISLGQPVYKAVYETFKDEYNRGIRIRKEPS